jgi:hypothetical protein
MPELNMENNIHTELQIVMFKIIAGKKDHEFKLTAISNAHAILVASDFHNKNGLIGRYYCETSTGFAFRVS